MHDVYAGQSAHGTPIATVSTQSIFPSLSCSLQMRLLLFASTKNVVASYEADDAFQYFLIFCLFLSINHGTHIYLVLVVFQIQCHILPLVSLQYQDSLDCVAPKKTLLLEELHSCLFWLFCAPECHKLWVNCKIATNSKISSEEVQKRMYLKEALW